jgi:hypothetical protein
MIISKSIKYEKLHETIRKIDKNMKNIDFKFYFIGNN